MRQFVPFDENVEVRGEVLFAISKGVNSIFNDEISKILSKNNFENIKPAEWYKQKDLLNVFKDIYSSLGAIILFGIGREIPENAIFPSGISNLKEALESINFAYNQNHRKGEIGYYKLVSWDENEKNAIIECKNPYPCHFDRGLITRLVNLYKPANSKGIEVFLDIKKPNRLNGCKTSWYIIKW